MWVFSRLNKNNFEILKYVATWHTSLVVKLTKLIT
jgi:hypothetical protein